MADREQILRQEILTRLRKTYPAWVCDDFQQLLGERTIKDILDRALTETAKRNYMNKHGIEHGLTVVSNMLHLFELIQRDIVDSDYEKDFSLEKAPTLFALLAASYIHDAGRFYDPDIDHVTEIAEPIEIIRDLAPARILGDIAGKDVPRIIRRIRELCLCHEEKDKESGKVEIALIKLADSLDCCKNRVYSEKEKPKELEVEHPRKMKTILLKDKHPEEYYGSLAIDRIEMRWDEHEDILEITMFIKNYAASVPIKRILNVLTKCEQSGESVQKLSQRIRVYIKEVRRDRYLVYPKDIIQLPHAELIKSIYNFDVKNMDGDTDIEDIFEIKNVDDGAGIPGHTLGLGGNKKISWGELEKKITMFDSEGKTLKKFYKYTEHDPRTRVWTHLWTVMFKERLQVGQSTTVKGKYSSWERFLNVKKDESNYKARTQCKHLKVSIIFPPGEGITKERTKAYIEIKNSQGTLYRTDKTPSVSYDKEQDRVSVVSTFDALKPGYTYTTKWELE